MKSKIIATTLASIFVFALSACDKNRHPASDDNDTKPTSLSYEKAEQNSSLNQGIEERQAITPLEQETETGTANTQAPNNTETDIHSNTYSTTPNTNDNVSPNTNSEADTLLESGNTAPGNTLHTPITNSSDNPAQNPNAITNPQSTVPDNS